MESQEISSSKSLTEEVQKNLEQNDKKGLLDMCEQALKETNDSKLSPKVGKILFEICWQAVFGKIQLETVISVLTEIVIQHKTLISIAADALVGLDTMSQVNETLSVRERFLTLLRMCSSEIIPECTIKERLDFETLQEAGIIEISKKNQSKFIKTKTRLLYKQQKYNLFREENEGYAKLITELNTITDNANHAKYVLEVTSLIGCFKLDPNRVLDIILESFEYRPDMNEFFVTLLSSFCYTSVRLSQVIGLKLSFYQEIPDRTPESLFRIIAFLLKEELLSLSNIYGCLTPDDRKMVGKQKEEILNALLYEKQLNSIATATVDKSKSKPQSKEPQLDIEIEDNDNQKVGFCAALLDIGDWKHAEELMAYFPEFYAISHDLIVKKLCSLAHVLSEKLYLQNPYSILASGNTRWKIASAMNVQECNTFPEWFERVVPIILCLGPLLHTDPLLIAKTIRLSTLYMLKEKEKALDNSSTKAIINVIGETLLPSLSLMNNNCCMAEELWSLLKLFPYQTRYCFYDRWKTLNLEHPLLIKKKSESLKKLKDVIKGLNKENVEPSGRQIGKLSHANPGDLFDYILSQIQIWDTLIVPVVDSLKYLNSLSYDVLAYCIISVLSNPEKDRMKHNGASISLWLQNLASFGGAVFKTYPIDIAGVLQYVANQLKDEKSVDLLILKEVVHKMAGIEALGEMTANQVEAMTGGNLLRSEGGYFNQLRNVKKSSQRLKETLLNERLAVPLCLLMAQQRQGIVFREQEQTHLKLIGKLYDQCQDTAVQFGNFLESNLNMEDYISRVPSILSLFTEYHIEADIAFFLVRPTFNHLINAKFEELKKADKADKTDVNNSVSQKYLEAIKFIVDPIVKSLWSTECPRSKWEVLSPQIYFTFWSLSVYDLAVPTASYEREIAKLKVISQSEENEDINEKKRGKEQCDELIAKLVEEEKMQYVHCNLVTLRLKTEKETWFNAKSSQNETITQFLQLCLFPRCIFTPVDAIYCAKFLHLVHYLKAPYFSTLLCYDQIFCDIANTVTVCTENQANRYGLFLYTMLETVMRWHNDQTVFDKECALFPGFMTKFSEAATQDSHDSSNLIDYKNYRHICYKWHFKMTEAFLNCLDSGDFIQIRNALLVLIKVNPFFPVVYNLGLAIDHRIQKIKNDEKNKRPDVYALATGYSGILKAQKSSFISEGEFHENLPTTSETGSKVKISKKSSKVETSPVASTKSKSYKKSNKATSFSNAQIVKTIDRTTKDNKEQQQQCNVDDDDVIILYENKSTVSLNKETKERGRVHCRHRSSEVERERDEKRRRTDNTSSKSKKKNYQSSQSFKKYSKDNEKNTDESRKERSFSRSCDKFENKTAWSSDDSSDDTTVVQKPRRRRAKIDEVIELESNSKKEDKRPKIIDQGSQSLKKSSKDNEKNTDESRKERSFSSSIDMFKNTTARNSDDSSDDTTVIQKPRRRRAKIDQLGSNSKREGKRPKIFYQGSQSLKKSSKDNEKNTDESRKERSFSSSSDKFKNTTAGNSDDSSDDTTVIQKPRRRKAKIDEVIELGSNSKKEDKRPKIIDQGSQSLKKISKGNEKNADESRKERSFSSSSDKFKSKTARNSDDSNDDTTVVQKRRRSRAKMDEVLDIALGSNSKKEDKSPSVGF